MIGKILSEYLYWNFLRLRFGINYHKVVLVLSEENKEVDRQAIIHLKHFMDRKRAKSAIVFCKEQSKKQIESMLTEDVSALVKPITNKEMSMLYSLYCFIKFFDNIVFTNTDTPEENKLGRYIRETDVNEEDAVCLALYHLRHVPQ